MISSFKNKALRELWETGVSSKLPMDQINKISEMMEVLDSAKDVPKDFELFKSWRIHPLKGRLKGYWSLTIKNNWRIIFRFNNLNVFDLDYVDYH